MYQKPAMEQTAKTKINFSETGDGANSDQTAHVQIRWYEPSVFAYRTRLHTQGSSPETPLLADAISTNIS